MKRFAVAYIDAFDNDLSIVIVRADTWRGALMQHPKTAEYEGITDNYEETQRAFWNCDASIAVTEIVD